jgi:hypothetical protein
MESAGSALKRILPELVVSKQKLRQAEGSCTVRWKREEGKQNVGFSSRPFVLCGLSVRKPNAVGPESDHQIVWLRKLISARSTARSSWQR